jgi:hypothetical protein
LTRIPERGGPEWRGLRHDDALEAITEMALNTVRRRLDQDAVIVDPVLLERYQALADQLAEQPAPPDLGPTLAALDPTGADPADGASVDRLDDFLEIHAVFDDEDVKLA